MRVEPSTIETKKCKGDVDDRATEYRCKVMFENVGPNYPQISTI